MDDFNFLKAQKARLDAELHAEREKRRESMGAPCLPWEAIKRHRIAVLPLDDGRWAAKADVEHIVDMLWFDRPVTVEHGWTIGEDLAAVVGLAAGAAGG